MVEPVRYAFSRVLRGIWRLGELGCSSLRKVRLRLMYPGFSIDRQSFVGPNCDIRVATGAVMQLTGCAISRNVTLTAGRDAELTIDADYIGHGSTIVARDRISIASGTKIAENAVIRDANHDRSVPLSHKHFVSSSVAIGKDVWIGAGVTVLIGAEIGDYSTIGAGAVVTGSIPPHSVALGIPARVR